MSFSDSEHPDNKYYKLAEKFLTGSITPEEEIEFTDWYDRLGHKLPVPIPTSFAASETELKSRISDKINSRLAQPHKHAGLGWRSYSAAAAVLLVVSAGIYFYLRPSRPEVLAASPPTQKVQPVKAGSDRAILTLSDGRHILLDDSTSGALTQQGSTRIIKLKSGQLMYKSSGGQQSPQPASFNTITTPRGGQYQIILPDNTNVWLNASSSLRFPTMFNGNERSVELTGEGYFEIAQNKQMPFKVRVNDMKISVLGTRFNVMAYNEENEIKTTLVEGSVKVAKGASESLLHPGEQASVKKEEEKFRISTKVNIRQVMAWKNGEFYFDNTDMRSVMAQIGRWYDVAVVYDGNISNAGFSGIIPRMKDISQILEILEATRRVRFKLEDRKIIVSPFN